MKKYIHIIILIWFFVLTGCRKDPIIQETPDNNNQRVQLTLNLPSPQLAGPATYAITANDENEITSVDVLAFKIVGGQERFMYRKPGRLVATGGPSNQAKFYADLLKGSGDYRFVIFCNASQEITNASAALTENKLKSEVLAAIAKVQTTKWNALSSTNFNPLPMWGESAVVTTIDANTANLNFSMLRSLAAIDVVLSGAALDNFLITAVSLYNSSDRGVIAPVAGNYDAPNKRVTQPSLLSAAKKLSVQDYQLSSAANQFKQEIYLFETAAANAIGDAIATGLVIGGRYNGSTTTTYYRVDLVNTAGTPINILRNYRYTININAVTGPGLPDKEQAWNSKRINMSANINAWNEASLGAVSIAEAYDLTLGQSDIQDDGGRKRLRINLGTGYSGGWTVSSGSNWITPVINNGPRGNDQTVPFTVASNTTNAVRTALLTVRAGKLSRTIRVTQAVPNFKDNIPGLNFYVANYDLPWNVNWYVASNVPEGFNATTDPMISQVSPARTRSCAQVYGEGWRLPTPNEYEIILIRRQQVGRLTVSDYYWTGGAFINGSAGSAFVRRDPGSSGGIIATWLAKGTTNIRSRCVRTIPN